jgi:hypothetical protein
MILKTCLPRCPQAQGAPFDGSGRLAFRVPEALAAFHPAQAAWSQRLA